MYQIIINDYDILYLVFSEIQYLKKLNTFHTADNCRRFYFTFNAMALN